MSTLLLNQETTPSRRVLLLRQRQVNRGEREREEKVPKKMVIEFTWSNRRRKEGARKVARGALHALGGWGRCALNLVDFCIQSALPPLSFLPWLDPHPSLDYSGNEGLSFKIRKKLCLYLPPHLLPPHNSGGLGQNRWWTQLRIEIRSANECSSVFPSFQKRIGFFEVWFSPMYSPIAPHFVPDPLLNVVVFGTLYSWAN